MALKRLSETVKVVFEVTCIHPIILVHTVVCGMLPTCEYKKMTVEGRVLEKGKREKYSRNACMDVLWPSQRFSFYQTRNSFTSRLRI